MPATSTTITRPTPRARADWSRCEHGGECFDRLHVRVVDPRSFCFVSYGRIVVQALSPGVSFRHGERAGALAMGRVLVVDALDAQLRVIASEGASFQVVLERGAPGQLGRQREVGDASPRAADEESPHEAGPAFDLDARPDELFLAAVARVAPLPSPSRLPAPVLRARNHITENIAADFGLDALSAIAAVGRCHLCRVFQRKLGLPPQRFRTHLRVAYARELLGAGLDCTKVAYSVGFYDQSHLIRCFKEVTGTTPGAYARASASPSTAWVRPSAA